MYAIWYLLLNPEVSIGRVFVLVFSGFISLLCRWVDYDNNVKDMPL